MPPLGRPRPIWSMVALSLGLALGQTGRAHAGAVRVTPTRVALTASTASALVTVKNEGSEPLGLQVSAFAWDQDAKGAMRLTPTEDILVFPTLLTVGPGQERNLRVGAATPFAPTEKTYRIFIEELPPPEKPSESGEFQLRMLTRLGVPVFLQPAKPAPGGGVDAMAVREGRFTFAVRNTGNVHFVLQGVDVKGLGPAGEPVFERRLEGWYVLSGGTRLYELELPPADCARIASVTAEARTPAKTFTARLAMPPGACAP